MTVEYARLALIDLRNIAEYYEGLGTTGLGDRVAASFDEVIDRIDAYPRSGRPAPGGGGLRVVPVRQYPYLIFYEIPEPGTVSILHIRHTSRRPWSGR
jgi:plasmid stabilization system protein ParE